MRDAVPVSARCCNGRPLAHEGRFGNSGFGWQHWMWGMQLKQGEADGSHSDVQRVAWRGGFPRFSRNLPVEDERP